MKYSPPLWASAVGVLFAVAGCSAAGSSAIAPSATQTGAFTHVHGRPLATPAHGYIYVADAYANTVWIFPAKGANPSPVGSITSGLSTPQGMAIDSTGNLYVTNDSHNPPDVTIYPPGSSTPSRTLTQDLTVPAAVAVDSKGNVWVSNEEGGYEGSVVEFPAGSSTPSMVLSGLIPYGVAVDSQGNLYVGEQTTTEAFIAVYPPGATKPSKEFGQKDLIDPYGVIVGPMGDIEVCDYNFNKVFIYAPKTYKLRHKVLITTTFDLGQLTLAQNRRLYVGGDDDNVVGEVARNGFGRVLSARLHTDLNSSFGVAADPPVIPGP